MKKDHWEIQYKDQAQEHSVSPPEHLWQNVEQALDKEKKRKPFIFWFLAGALTIASGAGFYFMNSKNSVDDKLVKTEEILKDNAGTQEAYSDNSGSAKIENYRNVSSKNGNELDSKDNLVSLEVSDRNSMQRKPGSELGLNSGTKTESLINQKNSHRKEVSKGSINKSTVRGLKSASKESGIGNNQNDIRIEVKRETQDEKLAGFLSTDKESIGYNDLIIIHNEDNSEINKGEFSLPALPESLQTLSSEALKLNELDFDPIFLPKNVQCPTFRKKKPIVPFVQLEVGAGLPMRHLTPEDEPSKIYVNKLATEKPWYSYNASFHAGVLFRNNMTLFGGINYTEVKEQFDYSQSGLTRIVIRLDIQTGQPIDTTLETGRLINSGENRFMMFNIPLAIGYQKKMKSWMLAGEVGAGINLYMTTSGKVLYSDNKVHYMDEVNALYKEKIGFNLNAALAIHYLLNDRTSIYIKPQYVLSLKDWSRQNIGFKSSYDLLNVNIGIRRSF